MKAMILAAGKGERMRPLTDNIPKPLLKAKGKTLIEHALDRVRVAGIHEVVINVSYLGHMIEHYLGDGSRYNLKIQYSREDTPLETGGGIAKALPLLCDAGENPFLLVNSDVWCDMELQPLTHSLQSGKLAHLVLVNNPAHHISGDFSLREGCVNLRDQKKLSYTYSGMAVIDPGLFRLYQPPLDKFPLRDLLLQGIHQQQVTGELYTGNWVDVGTPERLACL
jgi:MurNAc alpha-1-phosphate uridylyltransferase